MLWKDLKRCICIPLDTCDPVSAYAQDSETSRQVFTALPHHAVDLFNSTPDVTPFQRSGGSVAGGAILKT
jgi:hypothetical protein